MSTIDRWDNGRLEVAILPELGGRILVLRNLPDGPNCIFDRVRDEHEPMNAGLKFIVRHGNGKPIAPGCRKLAGCAAFHLRTPAEIVVTPTGRHLRDVDDGLELTVSLDLPPGSDTVAIRQTVRNLGNAPREVQLHLHGVWGLGGAPTLHDCLVVPTASGVERTFWDGGKCEKWRRPAAPWVGLAGFDSREAVLVEAAGAIGFVLVWANRHVYNLERLSDPAVLAPGEELVLASRVRKLSGFPVLDGPDPHGAGTDVDVYERGQPIRAALRLPPGPAAATLTLGGGEGRTVPLASVPASVPTVGADVAIPTDNLADGRYEVRWSWPGGTAVSEVHVIGDVLETAPARLAAQPVAAGLMALLDMGRTGAAPANAGRLTGARVRALARALSGPPEPPPASFLANDRLAAAVANDTSAPVPVPADRILLLGDMHSHSFYSDGSAAPLSMVIAAMLHGLDFLAMTDHNSIAGGLNAVASAVALGLEFPVIAGQEVSHREYHILGFGGSDTVAWDQDPPGIVAHLQATGAHVFLAHPGLNPDGRPPCEWQRRLMADPLAHGLAGLEFSEVVAAAIDALPDADVPPLTLGSDAHSPVFERPMLTVVLARERTAESVMEAVLDGWSAVILGERLYGRRSRRGMLRTLLAEPAWLAARHAAQSARVTADLQRIATALAAG